VESLDTTKSSKKWYCFSPNVFFLGIVSLLTDISSEMIFTLIPLFLCNVLGAGATIVGLVGGLSEGTDAVLRIFSGYFSDRIGKRKSLTLLGYGISTVFKPFMYLASNWGAVLAIRFSDRVGKGIRTSPRDALVADSVSEKERGKGFGLHRAMDTFGAVFGLIIAAVVIYYVQGGGLELGLKTYHWLVLIGVVPAVLAIFILTGFVREPKRKLSSRSVSHRKFTLSGITTSFDNRFKLFLAIIAVFTLGNSSDFLLILRAQNLGAPLIQVVLMLVLFNVSYASISLPAGMLSDKFGRRRVIIIGWLVYALVYLGFALVSALWQVWLLFSIYGIYYGVVEGVTRAFVSDLVPKALRGIAYGLYHGVVGFTLLFASLIAGWLWDVVSPSAPFYFGSMLAFLAMIGMIFLMKEYQTWA
jgi:MFS family permease